MKILVITEEDEFYLPGCLNRFLGNVIHKHEVVGVVLAKNTLLPSPWAAAWKFLGIFGVWPVLQQAFRLASAKLRDRLRGFLGQDRIFSMRDVCRRWEVECQNVDDVNAATFLQVVWGQRVDLIVSISPTQKFQEDLLQAAPAGCINIHSSKLPKFRGLYPTYWAMASGERETGVTVHFMNDWIDQGGIILQHAVQIPPGCSMDAMLKKTKAVGADLLAEAVTMIAAGSVKPFLPKEEGSYFSFPTKESYRAFRRLGYRLW